MRLVWWCLQHLFYDKTEKLLSKMQRPIGAIRWLVEEFVNDIGLKAKDILKESKDVLLVRHI